MRISLKLCVLFWAYAIPLVVCGQTELNSLISAPQGTPRIPVRYGSVNVNTGNLHLDIPLVSMSERGTGPSTTTLSYDSMFWLGLGVQGGIYPPTTNSYWTVRTESGLEQLGSVYPVNVETQSCGSGWYGSIQFYTSWEMEDSNGNLHFFSPGTTETQNCASATGQLEYPNGTGNQTASGQATDGSGFYLSITNGNSAQLFAPDGYTYGVTPNGNQGFLNSNMPASYQQQGFTEPSLGTDALPSLSASGCSPGRGAQPYVAQSSRTCQLTYRALNGSSASAVYALVYEYIPVCTGFWVGGNSVQQAYDYCGGIWAVQSLTMPDGVSTYTFTYDSGTTHGHYGQLLSMSLPTGGTVSYAYYPPSGINTYYQSSSRGDIEYIIDNGGKTSFSRTWCTPGPSCMTQFSTATITPPTHVPDPSQPNAAAQDQVVYSTAQSPASGNVTPTSMTEQVYLNGSLAQTKTWDTTVIALPSYAQSTWAATGATDRVQYTYTTGSVVSRADEYLNGSLYRSLVKQFQQDTSSIPYVSQYHMVNYPTLTQLLDGKGNVLAQEQRTYDEYGASYCNVAPPGLSALPMLTNITGAVGHEDTYHGSSRWARGNPTTITSSTSATTSITTHACYDTLGNVTETIDGNGNPTAISHADSFTDTNCILSSTPTYAFPTQVTDALGHKTKMTYNSCMRAVVQEQDPNDIANGRTGTQNTFDVQGRPLCTIAPDGGQKCTMYNSATLSTISQLLAANVAHTQTITLDAYGNKAHTFDQITGVQVDSTFDSFGRLSTVSNPYIPGSGTTNALTSYGYDGLNRITAILNPDKTEQKSVYTGQNLDTYDEAGAHHQLLYDSVGRLVSVFELGTTGQPLSLETDYTYDQRNNLTRVDQWGGAKGSSGERARIFSYDWISRLTSAQQPESGTTCYGTWSSGTVGSGTCQGGYDGNSNLLYKTDARNITVTYGYDKLNRLHTKTYSDGTPSVTMNYDESGDRGAGACGGSGFVQCNTLGRLSSIGTSNSTNSIFGYDPVGRTILKSSCIGTTCSNNRFDQYFTYDLAGNETSYDHGYNAAAAIYFGGHGLVYDAAGRIQSFTTTATATPLFTATKYGSAGLLESALGNALHETRSYDARLRQESYNVLTASPSTAPSSLLGFVDVFENNDVVRFPEQSIPGTSLPENGTLFVRGWVGTAQSCPVAAVEIDIDSTAIGYATLGGSRPDVQSAYSNDGQHAACGYNFTGSIGSTAVGTHSISVFGIDASGNRVPLIMNNGNTITVTSDPPPNGYIDGVPPGTIVTGGLVTIVGWAIDSQMHAPVGSVKILIDGQPVGYATLGISRPDVASAAGDPRYTNSGWTFTQGIGSLPVGNHTITGIVYDSGGQSAALPQVDSFTVVADTQSAFGSFDVARNAANSTSVLPMGGTLAAYGWAGEIGNTTACASSINRVDVLLDGNFLGTASVQSIQRSDVASTFNNRSCLNSGWQFTGTVSNVDAGVHSLTARAYDPSGGSTVLGTQSIQINAQLTPASITDMLPSQYSWSVGYDPNGNVGYSYDSVNGAYSYLYDGLNRLTAAGSNTNGFQWSYDGFGNRTAQTVSSGSGVSQYQAFSLGATNRPDELSFDAAGNALSTGGAVPTPLTYDAEGRISSANGYQYVYDALGQRVAKYSNGSITNAYLYDLSGHMVTELNSSFVPDREEFFLGGRHLATNLPSSSTITYVLSDWIGTERARAASAGTLCQTIISQPFGDNQQASGNCNPTSAFYTGKERDAESGLDYFGARYYSSNMGRFSSPDPSGLASVNPANPQSWNLYSYVLNNPLINVDPTGLDCVYYNDAGTGLDTDGTPIDHNSDSGTCKQTGGNWVEGTTSADLNHYDAGSGTWTAASYDKNNAYIYSGMSPGGPGSGNDSTNYMPACQGNCLSGSSAPISSLIGQLQGGGTLYGMLQFAVSQPLSAGVNGFQATSISANYGNTTTGSGWCGSGGSGPPGNSNGWSCLAHDYGYFVTGNAYPGGNYNPNYSGGPQLQKINQTLCNNVSGFGGFEIKAFFTATVWGCRP
jgi:RHS repeat-associated protein